MKRNIRCAAVLFTAALAACGADTFLPGCRLPFDAIKTPALNVDAKCGVNGGSEDPAKIAESRAKNNFCATGTARPVTWQTFTRLEKATTEAVRQQVMTDRSV